MKQRLFLDRIDMHSNGLGINHRIKRAIPVLPYSAVSAIAIRYHAPPRAKLALHDSFLKLHPERGFPEILGG
jgi:hypothetical protein